VHTISTTCPRTISSIIPVVSGEGSPVSPETNIICWISTLYLNLSFSDMIVVLMVAVGNGLSRGKVE